MNKHPFYQIVALLLCCALLAACGSEQVPTATPLPAESPEPTPSAAPTPALPSEAEQRTLIERSRSIWESDLEYETWYYTITDLDHNGRLEVLTASIQGTGLFTYVNCWEVNETGNGLTRCPDNTGEGDDWPDIIKDTLRFYRDPVSGRYTYVCEDFMRDGAAHYYTGLDSFCLNKGQIEVNGLAHKEEVYSEAGMAMIRYYDMAGLEISEETYNRAVEDAFAGQEEGTLHLGWTQLAPPATPQPTAQVTASGPVTVTKDPTGETVTVGGQAWFIAHADNATSLIWLFTSPQGQLYSLNDTLSLNPGLNIQELPEDTLSVSNVPASFDGWSVQARFDGPGGTAMTAPAMLQVEDFVTAYGGVISAYYRAYSSGNTSAEYAWNNGLSEMIAYSQHVGYALRDLNGDGIPELLVMGIGTDDFSNGMLYDLYTLANGEAVQLACSRARSRYYLHEDGSILNEGSNGAGNSIYVVNRLYGSELVPVESVFTWFMGEETDGYYRQSDGYSYEPREYDEYLTEESFNYFVGLWEGSVTIPALTQIA